MQIWDGEELLKTVLRTTRSLPGHGEHPPLLGYALQRV
jgi:hypothetical protein